MYFTPDDLFQFSVPVPVSAFGDFQLPCGMHCISLYVEIKVHACALMTKTKLPIACMHEIKLLGLSIPFLVEA